MKKILFFILIFFSVTVNFKDAFPQGKNMRLLKNINFFTGFSTSELWGYSANGREYAIVGGESGTHFVDITDSTNIHSVDFQPASKSFFRVIKTYSHYAYICSEQITPGVQIVDLQYLPDSIRYVGTYIPPGHTGTHTIQQSGPYLYLCGNNPAFTQGIAVLDLSVNPEQPVLRGKWDDLYTHDCRVINDTIWASNFISGKMSVINAVDKNNLTNVTNWVNGPNAFPHSSALTNDRKYIFTTDETINPPGRLKVWKVQNLSDIILEKIYIPAAFEKCGVHNVELYGNLLVSVYFGCGVKLFDVSNPVNPVEIGWYDTWPADNESSLNAGGWGVYMFPSGKIIATDFKKGLFVLRYSPPQNAKPKADFMMDKNTNYSVLDTVQFLDISTNNPTAFQWKITGPQNFSFTEQNPKLKFTFPGFYTISFKVSNAFGADSIVRENFRVTGTIFNSFTFHGNTIYSLITNKFDTSKVSMSWKPGTQPGINTYYKFRINKLGGTNAYSFLSDNNGADTVITFRRSTLDSIAQSLGLIHDSVITQSRAVAYNGADSLYSSNILRITFKSTSVGIQNISSQIPSQYKLENNFPNPFNPSTNIKFQLPEKSFAQIIIYDMLGREVQTILSEELNAGYYNFQFDAGNLNSGIYFYTLRTGKFSETKRMVLVK